MKLCEIISYLGETPRKNVAFAGAGGKTSCILELADAWREQGKKVLVTTSTHMEKPETFPLPTVIENREEKIMEALKKKGAVLAGLPALQGGKIQGLPVETYQRVCKEADCVLVEADGSRRFPVKVPKKGEPVIYENITHILILAGASALGQPLDRVCHRLEEAQGLFRQIQWEKVWDSSFPVTESLLGGLLEAGYIQPLKRRFPDKKIAVLLNQADVLESPEKSRKRLQEKLSVPGFLHGWQKRVHGIVLAAGFSTRFGENKLLYLLEGRPMYDHVLKQLSCLQAKKKLTSLTLVTQYEEIKQAAGQRNVTVVKNEDSCRGISSSLKLGLTKAMESAEREKEHYYMFFVADQPFLRQETIEEFLSAFLKTGKGIGCVCREGISGNPVIFHEKYVRELQSLTGDVGGKRVLKSHMEDVFFYEVSDERELKDIDRREEL